MENLLKFHLYYLFNFMQSSNRNFPCWLIQKMCNRCKSLTEIQGSISVHTTPISMRFSYDQWQSSACGGKIKKLSQFSKRNFFGKPCEIILTTDLFPLSLTYSRCPYPQDRLFRHTCSSTVPDHCFDFFLSCWYSSEESVLYWKQILI